MGLCINYDLHAPQIRTLAQATTLLRKLRKFAAKLPCETTDRVLTWVHGKDDPVLKNLFSYIHIVNENHPPEEDTQAVFVPPKQLAFFGLSLPGSETAFFGLAQYPKTASNPAQNLRNISTGLGTGWHWRAFPKTQYASGTQYGGFDNFFNIHDSICQTLDEVQRLGVQARINDESTYYVHRDREKLRAEIHRWNVMMAAFVGQFKDAHTGTEFQAEITSDPAFEHLEAQGEHLDLSMPDVKMFTLPDEPKKRGKRK